MEIIVITNNNERKDSIMDNTIFNQYQLKEFKKERSEYFSKRLFCFCLSFLLILGICDFLPINGEERVYTQLIRLHILANSDSAEDQNIKLLVRDRLIEVAPQFFDEEADGTLEAAQAIKQNIPALCAFVNNCLAEMGISYRAVVNFGKEQYPEREYDGITYPAGQYVSLRINLGDGEGKNWWCVMFPPLCTDVAKAKVSLDVGTEAKKTFTKKKPKYIIRLKILELFKRKKG